MTLDQLDSTEIPTSPQFRNLTGERFERLTVLSFAGARGLVKYWNVRCDCGTEKIVAGSNMTTSKVTSCGCRLKEILSERLINLTGRKFGRLLIGKFAEFRGDWSWWHATCDCGTEKIVKSAALLNNNLRSCGCLSSYVTAARNRNTQKQNGEAARGTIEYRAWQNIKNRCYDPNNKKYKFYGALGVKVCDRWLNSYAYFLADMGRRPPDKTSIDRYPNNSGDYEPTNCRWATYSEQNSNRRPYKRKWRSKAKGLMYG